MRAWHFTEMPYPDIPPFDQLKNTRVSIPNRLFDPKVGADLYHRYLDEHCIADDLGLDIMLNEHHASASCIDSVAPLPAAILARQTRKARILILGNPIANRGEPVRIAEEMAMIDCISRGRLDVGFVRGVPTEINPANSNPTMTNERLWEGIDLAMRAWTAHDGPFNYEGRFWHKRAVNIWPRPYQLPHPPVWITGSSDRDNVRKVAQHGFTFATFLQPYENTRSLFDEYRKHYVDAGVPHQGGTAFLPLVYTADSASEAEKGAQELLWYIRSNKTEPQFKNPPGYASIALNVQALQGKFGGRTEAVRAQGLDYMMEQGILIAGTPDTVAARIRKFYDQVGGFDHLLMMQQAGHLDHKRTVRSMTLFAKEVYPRIKDLPSTVRTTARAEPMPAK
jgi:alkanesulfonate monooxygenase SsuD/methylene tetrahydromethanopterin reductase-like flavin-dependent oxidoreductase (luciferase family)